MTERCVLDTGLVIRDLRGDARSIPLFNALGGRYILCVSAITVFEVIRGCRSAGQESRAHEAFARLYIIEIGYEAAGEGARIIRANPGVLSSERAGADSLIAASATTARAKLATMNTRQFSKLQWAGLDLLLIDQDAADWTTGLS